MSVTDEELMAFADGELSQSDAARISAAIAGNPALAARLNAERRLRSALRGEFDPVAEEPVPDSLTMLIAAAASQDAASGKADAQVLDFGAAQAKRETREPSSATRPTPMLPWGIGIAIAASLVLGLVTGMQFQHGDIVERNGALLASGDLAQGLDTKLSSDTAGDLRVLVSFRRKGGDYCRVFDGAASSGIACKDGKRWILQHVIGKTAGAETEYRQAGSANANLMAAAQDMAAGDPLDAGQERSAVDHGWRNRAELK